MSALGDDWTPAASDETWLEAIRSDDVSPSVTVREFVARRDENASEAIVEADQGKLLPAAGLAILAAKTGDGKTTLTLDLVLHAAAGLDYLELRFPRPARVLIVENEGPREAFREKLERKLADWTHDGEHVRVWDEPASWGAVQISRAEIRRRLRAEIERHSIDLVVADTLTRFGVRGNGTPEETREFVAWLAEVGLGRDVAFLLLHHPRTRSEAGETDLEQIAGAWPPHADLILRLQKLEAGRARLSFPKARWTRGDRPASLLAFDADAETFTYLGDDEREDRDYRAELVDLMSDGEWWTINRLRQKRDAGGIGADPTNVRAALEDAEVFERVSGDVIGERKDATFYRLRQASSTPRYASAEDSALELDLQASSTPDDASDATTLHPETGASVSVVAYKGGIGDDDAYASTGSSDEESPLEEFEF